jgi:uncharacterized phage-associated protein
MALRNRKLASDAVTERSQRPAPAEVPQRGAGNSKAKRRLGHGAALLFFGAMAIVHSWPLASDLGHLSRLDNHDAELDTWIVAWVAHALAANPLHLFEAPIFSESLSAWDMGPVVGRLWWTEKAAGETSAESGALDEAALNTIGYVLSRYGRLTGRDLEHMTHAEDPWRRADRRRDPGGSEPISNEWILAYFRADLEDEDSLWFDQDVREGFLAGAQERRSEQVSADSVDGIRARAS